MQSNNQSLVSIQSTETTPVRMVPIASSITPHGTAVSYGIQGSSGGSTINQGTFSQGAAAYSNQFGFTNAYPSVSASQFGLLNSGSYSNFGSMVRRNTIIQPSVDISETTSDIVVTAFVTNGISNDLSLNVKEDSLTISGSVWTGTDTLLMSRTVPLSTVVRADAVDASIHSGVLEIRLPKVERK